MKIIPIRQITPSSSEPAISQTFRIRKVESLLNGKEIRHAPHRHNFFFILALKKGHGTHVIDFTHFDITDHSIFILRPGQVHELTLAAHSSGYLMEFNAEFYHLHDRRTTQMIRKATTANFCQLSAESFDKLNAVLDHIDQEYTDTQAGYNEVIRAQLDIFFIQFLRNRQQSGANVHPTGTYDQERLGEFIELIEKHFTSKKQVVDYADMLNVSAYQLSAITKAVVGKTPSEIINEHIILESKRHLLVTSDQVNQIAWSLGYEDPSYFIRFFKKHTGYSPESFRAHQPHSKK
jgi:AraC family transcriptional regulator, transcriptional activator of pobA